MQAVENGCTPSFEAADHDAESRILLKMRKARFFAALRMTALTGSSAACSSTAPHPSPNVGILHNRLKAGLFAQVPAVAGDAPSD
jgi:hypothetical protein